MNTFFISASDSNEYSRTITSELGHILCVAEEKYGTRDYTYTILGVEFNQNGPRIWYPYPKGCKHIIIQISMDCVNDINRAIFQVAHEVIHCLSPTGGDITNVLEEGVANLFSIEYTYVNGNGPWTSDDSKYTEASELVKQLVLIDPNIIKKLRLSEPKISLIDSRLILDINPKIPEELANSLTKIFIK